MGYFSLKVNYSLVISFIFDIIINMPNDVILLNALSHELNDALSGGRVEKIYQPEVDEITVAVKSKGKLNTIVISASPTSPRAHLTAVKKENALNAPAFCMLLRKYLNGAILNSVQIFNFDRIIKFTFTARNELKDYNTYFLIAELMGRYSNIILTNSDFKIIDAIRRIHFDQSTSRYILPNLPYVLQPKNKISLDENKKLDEVFLQGFNNFNELPKLISGIGKETAEEIFTAVDPRKKLDELINIYNTPLYSPTLKTVNGKPKDYFVCKYASLDGEYTEYATLNECLDTYYTLYDGDERKKASSKTVTAALKRLQMKVERRIADYSQKIAEKDKAEKMRVYGELILNNLWQMSKQNAEKCTVFDYNGNKEITIKLDPSLSPQQNAQSYFKKYGKMKRGIEIAEAQLKELYVQREYLKSIEVSITTSTTKQEYDEILRELNVLSGYKKRSSDKSKEKPSRPAVFKYENCEIVFGRNNLQNAETTFKIASRTDVWLHVKNHHGSHVIIKGEYDENVLFRAAQIAAYYSDARNDGKVDVDYTQVKFVKKIPSALPGQVTYTNYKTITVPPLKED